MLGKRNVCSRVPAKFANYVDLKRFTHSNSAFCTEKSNVKL